VRVLAGAENLIPSRKRERERLGELVAEGYRLACQTYVCGDVTIAWDPDQKELEAQGRVYDKLKQVWLSKEDTE
jgi:ferredoxin